MCTVPISAANQSSNLSVNGYLTPLKYAGHLSLLGSGDQTRHGTFSFILPWLEQKNLHEAYQFKYHWDDTRNGRAVRNLLPILICPSAPAAAERTTFSGHAPDHYVSDYAVTAFITSEFRSAFVPTIVKERGRGRWGAMLRPNEDMPLVQVLDGLLNTTMVSEDGGRPEAYDITGKNGETFVTGAGWANWQNFLYQQYRCDGRKMGTGRQVFNCTNNNETYSFHTDGGNFLFGDGSVHFVPTSTDPDVFVSLLTCNGGDVVRAEAF